jgi:hypothetical protein
MSVRAYFSSPRRRRRAVKLAIVTLAALGVALLLAFDRNTVPREPADKQSNEPAFVPKDVPQVRLPRSAYYKARDVAFRFIATAVERKHLDQSCRLVTRHMMQGMTCRQWQTEDIPVVPYDADESLSKYVFDFSFRNSVGIKVALFPKPRADLRPSVFRIDLERKGPHSPWLVDDWQPAGVTPSLAGGTSPAPATVTPSLSATWLLVPVGIFGLLLLVPLTIGVRDWRRRRRADAAYPPGPLPPLRSQR